MKYELFIASDHAGVSLKRLCVKHLQVLAHNCHDLGPLSNESVDYPDYAEAVCREVVARADSLGVLICGTGIGMAIASNKIKGIRAAVAANVYMSEMARRHNNANVLCLGARILDQSQAIKCLDTWLSACFEGGRHDRRLQKISSLECL